MTITKGYKQLIADARAKVRTLTLDEARTKFGDSGVVFVDIRDVRELDRDGMIPGAIHAPRGMLEFWVDPESPYYRPVFGEEKEFVLYCASAWRSSLAAAALYEMGMTAIAHLDGGFSAWKEAGHPVSERKKHDHQREKMLTDPIRPSLVHSIDFDIGQPMVCDDPVNGQSLCFANIDGRQVFTYVHRANGMAREVTLTDAEATELTAWRNNGRRTSYWDWPGWDAVKARAHPVSS